MTVAQKVSVLTGASGSSYVGYTPAIAALCIPALKLQDGPAGVGDGMAQRHPAARRRSTSPRPATPPAERPTAR